MEKCIVRFYKGVKLIKEFLKALNRFYADFTGEFKIKINNYTKISFTDPTKPLILPNVALTKLEFTETPNLKSIDLSHLDTSNITNLDNF